MYAPDSRLMACSDWLRNHVRDAHHRILRPREVAGDAAILDSIKDEADLTEAAVHPVVAPAAPAPAPAPAAPAPAPTPAPAPAAPAAPAPAAPAPAAPVAPVAPVAPNANIDWATVPGYYLYFGIPYGTGSPIPGGL